MSDPETFNSNALELFDIVIVGAGMVGLVAANLILNTLPGTKVAIIEARPVSKRLNVHLNSEPVVRQNISVNDFQPRVSAITLASEQLFRSVGIWEALSQRATPFSSMQVREYDGTGEVGFDAFDVGEPYVGYIIENHCIEELLLSRLALTGSESNRGDQSIDSRIRWFSPDRLNTLARVEQSSWRLSLSSGREIAADVVVVADGAQSPTRAQLGFNTVEWDYCSTSIVATVELSKPHAGVARQVFSTDGPLAFLPLGGVAQGADARFASIVWSVKPDVAKRLLAYSDAEFSRALEQASQGWLGSVAALSERFSFPLKQRHATCYTQAGAVLVGDAAHSIHPLAGQGVNLGIMDVAVLVEEWASVLDSGLSLGDERILRRYERRRKAGNVIMTSAVELFKRIYEADSVSLRLARNRGMRFVNDWRPLKNKIMTYAMGRVEGLPSTAVKEPVI